MTIANLETKAATFRDDNPLAWQYFCQFANEARAKGFKHFGAGAVWERMRWELAMRTVSEDAFKLNNNHRAYFARWYMLDNPEADGFFRTRTLTSKEETTHGHDFPG